MDTEIETLERRPMEVFDELMVELSSDGLNCDEESSVFDSSAVEESRLDARLLLERLLSEMKIDACVICLLFFRVLCVALGEDSRVLTS